MTTRRFVLALLLCVTAGVLTAEQRQVLRSSAEAVIVDAGVWDDGRPVRGLTADDFELTDNGVRQRISLVRMAQGPIRVSIVADLGVVERPIRDRIRSAVSSITSAAHDDDELFLHRADTPRQPGVRRSSPAWDSLLEKEPTQATSAIHDAIRTAAVSDTSRRSLVLVLGPARDDSSWVDLSQLRDRLLRSRATVSLIVFPSLHSVPVRGFARTLDRDIREHSTRSLTAFGTTNSSLGGLEQLTSLCEETGGTLREFDGLETFAKSIHMLMDEFRLRYEISYIPTGVELTGWHQIGLSVSSRQVDRLTWRQGYMRNR